MSQAQTLSSGLTEAQKGSLSWAFTGVSVPSDPLSGTMGILKYAGAGGSHFAQSIPGALILNADHTPVVHHPLRAHMWPLVVNNAALEPDPRYPGDLAKAKHVKMVWDKYEGDEPQGVMSKVELLVKLAAENKPRPTVVVIDTVDSIVDQIMPWLTHKFGKEDFSDLGQTGWVQRQNQFWDRLYWPLKWAGYPIIMLIQIYDEPITVAGPNGQGQVTKFIPNTSLLSEKLAKRLRDACNVVCKIEKYTESGHMKDGRWVKEERTGWQMIFRDPAIPDLKTRPGLPDKLDITGPDSFKKYATAYTAAAYKDVENGKSL